MPRASTSSASQRPSRRSRRDVSDDEDEEDEEDGPGPATQGRELGQADIQKRASLLVRTALTMHYAGKVFRRADISKLVGGKRFFGPVFNQAQQTLRYIMGMELYEMPQKWKQAEQVAAARAHAESQRAAESQSQMSQSARKGKGRARPSGLATLEEEDEEEEEDGEYGAQTQVQEQAQQTQSVGAAKKEKGSQIYVLRSILPSQLQQALAKPEPFPVSVLPQSHNPMEEDSGAPIRWEAADATVTGAVELVAVRSVILALILANGRQISNADLLSSFRRLQILADTPLPFHSREMPNPQSITFDRFLDLLDRSLYLQKIKPPGQTVAPGESSNAHVDWRWGQRAYAEFGEKAAAAFIQDLMFGDSPDDGQDGDDGSEDEASGSSRRRSGTQRNGGSNGRAAANGNGEDGEMSLRKRRKKMYKDIETAAGSELQRTL